MFDVTVRQEVDTAPETAAVIMFDYRRDPEWTGGADRVRMMTPEPYGVGSQVRREGAFLGRTIGWTTETTAYEPGRRAHMRITDGPFHGEVAYAVHAGENGGAVLEIHNVGHMRGMPDFLSRFVVSGSVASDLKRLKKLVEAG